MIITVDGPLWSINIWIWRLTLSNGQQRVHTKLCRIVVIQLRIFVLFVHTGFTNLLVKLDFPVQGQSDNTSNSHPWRRHRAWFPAVLTGVALKVGPTNRRICTFATPGGAPWHSCGSEWLVVRGSTTHLKPFGCDTTKLQASRSGFTNGWWMVAIGYDML